ncbi:putative esterase [Paenibacillus sp. 598K]|uniref:alpha/beta fold hydrolase n=1 Tax=Paenibacillus sp. 598K TaxID=1117987 RepID=UPI000FF9847F|nr:alpha/beta hydrolase [Paenibacillus sp. 598K]GBF76584.1 putative esterase [Paenibacillus sp. 598K]
MNQPHEQNGRMIKADGVEIYAENFGDPSHPALLLIMGAQASLVWWEEEFCGRLAAAGRYVIRYDNRNVGRSSAWEAGALGYTFEDMADDAIRVLDAYGIGSAHIAGMSMGGMLTQMIALRHPQRVLTISLIATSNFAAELPPPEERVNAFFEQAGDVDWSDDAAVTAITLQKWRVLHGERPFDEERVRHLAALEVRHARNIASINNHALITGVEPYLLRTAEIAVPTLVIHGTLDPVIPYVHGEHLVKTIPGARLLTLEGAGHELHTSDWDAIIAGIAEHTTGS